MTLPPISRRQFSLRSHSLRYTLWTLQWTGYYLLRCREVLYGFLDARVSVKFHSTLQRIYTNFFPFHQSQFRSRQLTCWLVWKFIFIRSTEAIVLLFASFPQRTHSANATNSFSFWVGARAAVLLVLLTYYYPSSLDRATIKCRRETIRFFHRPFRWWNN